MDSKQTPDQAQNIQEKKPVKTPQSPKKTAQSAQTPKKKPAQTADAPKKSSTNADASRKKSAQTAGAPKKSAQTATPPKKKPAQTSKSPAASASKKAAGRKKKRSAGILDLIIRCTPYAAALILALLVLFASLGGGADDTLSIFAAATTAAPTETPTSVPTAAPTAAPTATPAPSLLPATDLTRFTEGGLQLTGETDSGNMPYQIYVSKETFTIAILGADENGEYTRLLRTWRAAIGTGNKTRAGSYEIDKKYLWYEWQLGGYTPYTSRLGGSSIRLHSPLHNENGDWESLYREGYRQIGSKETQGCLRTTTAGAAWVYYNCPIGTEVVIKNDGLYESENPPELGDSHSDPTRPMSSDDLEIPVTFFTVGSDSLSMTAGDTHQLTVSGVLPTLEEHEEIEEIAHSFLYVSGDENIVAVDESGVITAVGEGGAEVLVMANDINKAYRIITVSVSGL